MIRPSFRSVSALRVYPGTNGWKRWLPAVLACPLALTACGGASKPGARQVVRGTGFVTVVPADWDVARAPRQISATKKADLVSVTIFRLVRPYRPALWPKVVPELDRLAGQLAVRQKAELDASRTVHVLGQRSRQYDLSLGEDRERITFLFGRREFQLLCRWKASDGEPDACGLLIRGFKPAPDGS